MRAELDLEKPISLKTIISISAAAQSKMNLCFKKSLKSCSETQSYSKLYSVADVFEARQPYLSWKKYCAPPGRMDREFSTIAALHTTVLFLLISSTS